MRLTLTANDRARFWAKVKRGADDECWEWTAARNRNGYGAFSLNGKMQRAHRIAFACANGDKIDDGYFICHACDNPPCVNPAHLRAGTPADNVADMHAKGRGRAKIASSPRIVRERHWRAKLDVERVRAIRTARANGESYKFIAFRFGVSKSTIIDIIQRKTWGNIA